MVHRAPPKPHLNEGGIEGGKM